VKRTLGQFTPAQWDKDEWYPLLGPWRFIQVLSLCVIFMTIELNTFFLKFCLWIPPRNPLIVYRLVLWWLIAIPTIREYNTYLQDRYNFKLTSFRIYILHIGWHIILDDLPLYSCQHHWFSNIFFDFLLAHTLCLLNCITLF
jgi:hypothetical protein